eukprot:Skav230564  [mRNA]  locus=scaffold2372:215072:220645:- [translate_table: standard]
MDVSRFLRDAFKFSFVEFKSLWTSVRDFILIEALDHQGKAQGLALLAVQQVYKADDSGAFAIAKYVGCSDQYYQYWVTNEMDSETYHHFCRGPSLRKCISELGKDLVVHVRRWGPVTLREGESCLREWGMSPTLAKRALTRPGKAPTAGHEANEGAPSSKSAPSRPPHGVLALGNDLAGDDAGGSPRVPARRRKRDDSRDEEEDRREERRNLGRAATGSRDRPPLARKVERRRDHPQAAALDEMLDAAVDEKADDHYEAAKEKLATLKENLAAKKVARKGEEPGAILATRAAEVASKQSKKKKKKGKVAAKLASALQEAIRGKSDVKEEVDYEEDGAGVESAESAEEESEEEDSTLLGVSLGSGKSAGQQKKLRSLSERQPGKLLSQGYATMHDQVGTHFGGGEKRGTKLSPVAVRYLLSFAMPQFTGGVSHHKYRELRTLATGLDLLVTGRTGQCGDLLLQRFKSILMSLRDGTDTASKWLELLPMDETPTMATMGEDYAARRMAWSPEGEEEPNTHEGKKCEPKSQKAGCEGSREVRGRARETLGQGDSIWLADELSKDEGTDAEKGGRVEDKVEEPCESGHDECPEEGFLSRQDWPGGTDPGEPLVQWMLEGEDEMKGSDFVPGSSGDAVTAVSPFEEVAMGKAYGDCCPVNAGDDGLGDARFTGSSVGSVKFPGRSSSAERPKDVEGCDFIRLLDGSHAFDSPRDDEVEYDFSKLFHIGQLQCHSIHEVGREVKALPSSPLQLGISFSQLLLLVPRDGNFILEMLRKVGMKNMSAPTRRDLLPFQFCPSVGAAVKLVKRFPVSDCGVIRVDKAALKGIPRQQKGKLVNEGCFQLWRWLIVMVLNGEYMDWKIPQSISPSSASLAQVAALEMIGEQVKRVCQDPLISIDLPQYPELLKMKKIDHAGDEITTAIPLRLEELLPGLPEAAVGGSLDPLQVASPEVTEWLVNPERVLKPVKQWPKRIPRAKINCTRTEWDRVVAELYRRNILAPVEEDEIFRVGGTMVLNGAFAVLKSGTPMEGEKRITRLIMNMVPGNSYQMLMQGDLQTLSSSTNWSSVVLKKNRTLLWSSDDQRGAFYAWRLPPQWRKYMAFAWPVKGSVLGLDHRRTVYVASAVIPMGWLNAVSLFQHLHRQLGMSDEPVGAGFPPELEWRRDRPVPQRPEQDCLQWVQYYLDDFDSPEVVPEEDVERLKGTVSAVHQKQRDAYARQGVDISERKSHLREPVIIRMGAYVDGQAGIISAPRSKMFEVMGFFVWALGQDKPINKSLRMILGRLVRCFEFRRPLMSLLRSCWPSGSVLAARPWKVEAFRSLLRACIMLPMAQADLRAQVDGLVSASDASEDGGGLCVSNQLSDEGDRIREQLNSPEFQRSRCAPFQPAGAMLADSPKGPRIFVLSLFDGVAAIMVALCRLPCRVVGFAASEIDLHCKRLVRKRWPGVIELGKVETIDAKVIETLVTSLGYAVDAVLISAGSPCQDLTRLLANRQGLQGDRSKLFFEIPRIVALCEQRFPNKVYQLVENVESMTDDNKRTFNQVLGVKALLINAHDLGWVRRPRLYWCSWPVEAEGEEQVVDQGIWDHWIFPDAREPSDSWVDDSWERLHSGPLPTFTRALPRAIPPRQPAGLAQASVAAKERWAADRHRFQVYQYENHHLLWRGDEWRLPSLRERERVTGPEQTFVSMWGSPFGSKLILGQAFEPAFSRGGLSTGIAGATQLTSIA